MSWTLLLDLPGNPKLRWVARVLTDLGIPYRCNGGSFQDATLEVPSDPLQVAQATLAVGPVAELEDDDPMFSKGVEPWWVTDLEPARRLAGARAGGLGLMVREVKDSLGSAVDREVLAPLDRLERHLVGAATVLGADHAASQEYCRRLIVFLKRAHEVRHTQEQAAYVVTACHMLGDAMSRGAFSGLAAGPDRPIEQVLRDLLAQTRQVDHLVLPPGAEVQTPTRVGPMRHWELN